MSISEKLTPDFLIDCYNKELSSKDISELTGINSRTIRWYMKKHNSPVLKTKDHPVWNKGITADKDERVRRACEAAHNAVRGNPSWNLGLKTGPLSNEHKLKVSLALRGKYLGDKTSNWKGGTTPKNKLARTNSYFKRWRKSVFERDGYRCAKCGISNVELHPHHIKGFAAHPELRYDVDNGITFCKPCHLQEHKELRVIKLQQQEDSKSS